MNLLYVKIIAAVVCVLGIFYAGWHTRDVDYMAFKKEVESVAKMQEAKIESITKQQALVTKGIQDEHEAKLAAVRNYYKSTSVWNNASGSTMPGISAAPSATDVIAAYNELAGRCAETTLMLVDLQKWLNAQVGVSK
jgi:hypothetical protein